MKKLILFTIWITMMFLVSISWAAVHYASPSGSATYANSTNISTPCSAKTAFDNAVAGDTVYFRGGDYSILKTTEGGKNNGGVGAVYPKHNGTVSDRIVLEAYPNDLPTRPNFYYDPASDQGPLVSLGAFDTTAGSGGALSYVTFKGFVLHADFTYAFPVGKNSFVIVNHEHSGSPKTHDIIVDDCEIIGDDTSDVTDNDPEIFMQGVTDTTIKNCKIHNGGNVYQLHACLIMSYDTADIIVEHNELYTKNTGIWIKGPTNTDWIVRFNYFHDLNYDGIVLGYAENTIIYQNIFENVGQGSDPVVRLYGDGSTVPNTQVYNNTMYGNCYSGIFHTTDFASWGDSFYNNIMAFNSSSDQGMNLYVSNCINHKVIIDYNNYYVNGGGSLLMLVNWGTTVSWANWQGTYTNDVHGYNNRNPLFVNPSAHNFKLQGGSPCLTGGNTGGPQGAYITGNEEIGIETGGDTTPPVVTISTSDPSNIILNSLSISGTASDEVGVTSCKYRIGSAPDATHGTAITGTTSWSGTATGFAEGANTLYVGCTDAAGNWGSDSITVNLNTPPAQTKGVTVKGGLWK
jgi:hypothetical protein